MTIDASQAGPERHGADFLVGAAIGNGMSALSAMRGGADFLLALSAGRVRTMGEPSIVSMLPLQESNEAVFGFAEREILPRATVPVFFGACVFDPRQNLAELVDRIAAAGFAGVANFPTAIHIDGRLRMIMEGAGVGFQRELDLLALARERGLKTLAYSHTVAEARRAAATGVDIVNVNLGWNMGGVMGVDTDQRVEEAALLAQSSARAIRAISPGSRCVVEGGPIVSPRQLEELCRIAQVNGYIGGSTIDRVPSENAIEVVTSAFKAIGVLRKRIDGLERRLEGRAYPTALKGRSELIEAARAMYRRLCPTDHICVIVGDPGSGRREVAQALHSAGPRKSREAITLDCAGKNPAELRTALFGAAAGPASGLSRNRLGWLETTRGSSLILDNLECMDRDTQGMLLEAMESGRYRRLGASDDLAFDIRLIGLVASERDGADNAAFNDHRFAAAIGSFRIVLPPLGQRLEDLPLLVDAVLGQLAAREGLPRCEIDPVAFRMLEAHDWPGDVRELRSVLENAVLGARGSVIGPQDIPPLTGATERPAPNRMQSEIDWILDGLKRNRFRRGQTAAYLGISRKTLYNKMRRHGLLGDDD